MLQNEMFFPVLKRYVLAFWLDDEKHRVVNRDMNNDVL